MADAAYNPALAPTAVRCPSCLVWQPWREAFTGILDMLTKFTCTYCHARWVTADGRLFVVKSAPTFGKEAKVGHEQHGEGHDEDWLTVEPPQGRSWAFIGGVRPPRVPR